jgi:putative lipoprotein
MVLTAALLLSGCAPIPARDDPWSGPDKAIHFGASALIAAAAAQSAKNHEHSDCEAFRIGFIVSSGAGVAKELVDANIRQVGWSWRDLVLDGLGAVVGSWVVAPCR